MDKLNLDRSSLRKFGITMGIAFLIITIIISFRHKYSVAPTAIISIMFLTLAITLPGLLKLAYIPWMRLAFILGWMNTRLILIVMFYLLFAPIGLVMRLFRIDLLDRKADKHKDSYWRKQERIKFNLSNYERQF